MKDLKQKLQKFELFYQHLNKVIHEELGFDFRVNGIEYIDKNIGYIDIIAENIPCVTATFSPMNDNDPSDIHARDRITKIKALLLEDWLLNT